MAPQSTARPATPLARRREWWLRPRWLLLLLSVTVILAQAAFWGMTALLRTPPPYPALDLVVTGEGRYQDSIWPLPFTLVYTDHVPITLTIEPAAPVSLSLRPWGEDGLLTPTSTLAVSDSPHIGVTGPLMEGHNLLVVEGPPGHQAAASVWYLPRSAPYDLSHITRTLAITITPERIQAVYEADFGPGAPRDDLTDLWADDIPPGLFLKRVFYPTRDDFTAAALTTIGTPLRTVQGDTYRVRIHASSDEPFYNPERLPILLNVCPAPPGEVASITTVRVAATAGAHLQSCWPPPNIADAQVWTWILAPGTPSPQVRCQFGGRIDPTRSPVAWGRHQLTRLTRAVWGWDHLSWYVVWVLPWLIPWLYGALASVPLLFLHATTRAPRVRRVTTAGLGLAFAVAWSATTAQVGAFAVHGLSMPGLLWAGGLAGLGVLLFLFLEPPPTWRWPLIVAFPLLAGGLLAATVRCGGWTSGLVVALLGAPFPTFVLWLGVRAWRERAPARRRSVGPPTLFLLAMTLLLLSVPTARRPADFSPVVGAWSLNPGRELALLSVWVGLPYTSLALLAALLIRSDEKPPSPHQVRRANEAPSMAEAVALLQAEESTSRPQGRQERRRQARRRHALALLTLLFAAFAVGLMRRPLTTFAVLAPIAPLLAWAGFRLLLRPLPDCIPPEPLRVLLAAPRRRREITAAALRLPEEGKDEGDHQQGTTVANALRPFTDLPGRHIRLERVAFAWGGGESGWQRGIAAATRALALTALLGAVFAPALASEVVTRAASAFGPLETLSVFVGPFVLRWLLYAFVLGYGFPYLRGNNGWEKGLYLGLVVALSNLVQDTVLYASSLNDVRGLLLEAGVTVAMTSAVGVWAFDWRRVAEAGGRLTHLRSLYGLSTVTGYLTSMLPPVATIIVEAVQGHLDSLLQAFIDMVLPTIRPL